MRPTRAFAGLAAMLLALAAAAAPSRESVPPVGTPHPFALAARQEYRLDNGLAVTLVPFGTAPKATIMFVLQAGSSNDGGQHAVADLVAACLKEGAGTLSGPAVARLAAEMGGALSVDAGPDQTTVWLDVLAERSGDAIALIGDVLRRPRLRAAELPRLKADMTRAVAIRRSQAQGVAGEAFAQLLWGDSAYGWPLPTAEDIAAVTIDDVRRFVASQFGAARTHVYIVGRFDGPEVERALGAAFGDWSAGPPASHVSPSGSRARVVRLIDRPGAAQSTVMLGLPVRAPAAPGFMSLSLANALLGGSGLISRLDQSLREDKGYTYGVGTYITPHAGVASWTLATDVNAPDTAAALDLIFRELARLRVAPPAADELQRVRNYRAGTFVLGASSRGGLLGQLAFLDQQGLPREWLVHYVERLQAVTPDEVRAAAAADLDSQAITLVVVGDLATVRPGILALKALQGAEFR